MYVAPHVGAWIETSIQDLEDFLWVSHPMWVRGLKPKQKCVVQRFEMSHPMWVRGLKHLTDSNRNQPCKSHPMWVRGLKRSHIQQSYKDTNVAPHVGAWIETKGQKKPPTKTN